MSKDIKEPKEKKKDWFSLFIKDEKNLIAKDVVSKGHVATKSPSVNWALSGGFRKGMATCLYGPEGSGKSFLSMIAAAAIHQEDPDALVVLVTTEFRPPTPARLIPLGVDPKRLLIRQANTLHDVFDWVQSMDSSFKNSDGTNGAPGLQYMLTEGANIKGLIIDSVKGIQGPKEQRSDSSENEVMGDLSKFLNPALRSMLPIIRKYDITTLLVQQVNMNMNPDEVKYQNRKWLIPSGQALKHFCEAMVLVERVEKKDSKIFSISQQSIRELPVQEGHTIRMRVEKDNLGSPFREAEFRVHYKKGIVQTGLEVALLGTNLGVIGHPLGEPDKKTGERKPSMSWWEFGATKVNGFDNLVEALEADQSLQSDVMGEIYKREGISA